MLYVTKKDLLAVLAEFPKEKLSLLEVARKRRENNFKSRNEVEIILDIKKNFGGLGYLSGELNVPGSVNNFLVEVPKEDKIDTLERKISTI